MSATKETVVQAPVAESNASSNMDIKIKQETVTVLSSSAAAAAASPAVSLNANGYVRSIALLRDLNSDKINLIKKEAVSGKPIAQTELGSCYKYGFGVTRDDNLAFENFRLAAAQGNTEALMQLCLFLFWYLWSRGE